MDVQVEVVSYSSATYTPSCVLFFVLANYALKVNYWQSMELGAELLKVIALSDCMAHSVVDDASGC